MPAPVPPSQPKPERRKRKDSDSLGSEADGGGTFEVYQSAAMTFQNTRQFMKAIENYTKALDLRDGDKSCLVARSQCYLALGDAERGLADAEKTLEDDPNYIKGILQRAESYYQQGQFEFALMHYHRGYKLRPEVQAFRLGIQKSQEAIDNCIGEAAGIKLTKAGDLSYFNEERQNTLLRHRRVATGHDKFKAGAVALLDVTHFKKMGSKAQQKRGGGYQRPGSRDRKKKRVRDRKNGPDQKTVKQLLGDLYADKEYLEQLLKETETAGNQSETNKEVYTLADDCLNYLDTRTSFWQQQKPMYSRKTDKKRKGQTKCSSKKNCADWVLGRLEQIDNAQADGRFEDSLKIAKRTLKEVDKWSAEDIPNRPEVVANLHSCHGNAYLELGAYAKALHHHTVDNEIGEQQNIEESKSRSLDNLGRVYARMGEYAKAIDIWEKKIPMVKSALECTWLYHEIGRCHLELKSYTDAKGFGEKSLEAADEAGDEVWQLNATVLIAQCEVKLREFQSAIDYFDKAFEMSKVQGDRAAESAIRKAIEDVNRRIVEEIKDQGSEKDEKEKTKETGEQDNEEQPSQQKGGDEKHEPVIEENQEEQEETKQEESEVPEEQEENEEETK